MTFIWDLIYFAYFNMFYLYFGHKVFLYLIICLCTFQYVQANVVVCQNVQSPSHNSDIENCSLVCSLKFEYVVSGVHLDERVLCSKNTSIPITCNSHGDCQNHHRGAYCKMIPCLCKTKQDHYNSYILDSSMKMPKLNACVVSSRSIDPDLPIVPFPWKTLLIVIGIVLMFGTCLMCLKWLSPLIRSMQAKRTTRENREGQELPEDNTSLFSSTPQQSDSTSSPITYYFPRGIPRIYRANPRTSQNSNRSSSRAHYVSCSQAEATLSGTATLSNQDKPPPYEIAVQLPPPTYEDVERAILESTSHVFRQTQRVEVHPVPSASVPLPVSSPAS